jgi:hypothetical protein
VRTNHVSRVLPDYIRGTLDKGEVARVEEHLRECPACRTELAEVAETLASIERAGIQDVPKSYFSSIVPRVHQRLDGRKRIAWSRHPIFNKILVPLGAALVLAALVWRIPLQNGVLVKENPLIAVVDSATPEEIAEMAQANIPNSDINSFNDAIMAGALADGRFVDRELVQEALASESTSPFNVFADVSPQQLLDGLGESGTDNVLQRLGTKGAL